MKINKLLISLIIAGGMLLSGCSSSDNSSNQTPENDSPTEEQQPVDDSGSTEQEQPSEEDPVDDNQGEEETPTEDTGSSGSEDPETPVEPEEPVNNCSWYVAGTGHPWGTGVDGLIKENALQMSESTDYVAEIKLAFEQGDSFYVINYDTSTTLGYSNALASPFTLEGDDNLIIIDFNINLYVRVTTDNQISIAQK